MYRHARTSIDSIRVRMRYVRVPATSINSTHASTTSGQCSSRLNVLLLLLYALFISLSTLGYIVVVLRIMYILVHPINHTSIRIVFIHNV